MSTLDRLSPGQTAIISALDGEGARIQRLLEMGLLPGETVELIGRAPLGDPLAIYVRGSRLAVRKADARHIRVRIDNSDNAINEGRG
jgi:Fe2+ transport system protein FeoA